MILTNAHYKLILKFSSTPCLVVQNRHAYLLTEVRKPKKFRAQVALRVVLDYDDCLSADIYRLTLPPAKTVGKHNLLVEPAGVTVIDAPQAFPGAVTPLHGIDAAFPFAMLENIQDSCADSSFFTPYTADTMYPVEVWEFIGKAYRAAQALAPLRTSGLLPRNTLARVLPDPERMLYWDVDAGLAVVIK